MTKHVVDQAIRPARRARAVDPRLDDRRPRRAEGGADGRPPADLGPAGARRRDGHAERPVRAPRPALVRLLRPAPDRAADVARDRRPPGRPLLPRLRPDLLLPERAHGRLRDGRPLLLRVAAGADHPGGDPAARRARLPVQPRRPPDPPRRPAEARRRRDRRPGEHRRRPRRQGVRPGAGRGGEVRRALRGGLPPDAAREPAARALRAADLLRSAPRAGGRAARRGPDGPARDPVDRRLRRVQPVPRHARDAPALARHVDRPGAAGDRLRRADLPGHGRTGGGRRPSRRGRAAAGARARAVRERLVRVPAGPAGPPGRRSRPALRPHRRPDRPYRIGQDDAHVPRAALLRRDRRAGSPRRPRCPRRHPRLAPPGDRRDLAGSLPLLRHRPREHRVRRRRPAPGGGRGGRAGSAGARLHRASCRRATTR